MAGTDPTPEHLHLNPQGSLWHRWDPHIHGPGTVLNDQYGGPDAWNDFLTRIEQSDPPIRALGITDYLGLAVYERVQDARKNGRLPGVGLVFPNVEMRFAVNAGKGSPVNFHLLISPEAPDHVERAKRLLLSLTFEFEKENYRCCPEDLILLGKAFDKTITDDGKALEVGTNQFKVDPDQLLQALRDSSWAKENILIGVAGSSKDGTAQLQADASLSALRRKLEAASHVVFSSQEKQREFWLGKGALSVTKLVEQYGGCKPCLHGSDAHDAETVGNPALNRFTWINGDLTFESLRQACIEPEGRAYIGERAPRGGMPSHVASEISTSKADWLATPSLPLNPGLVAVIGARGSGKTALVEIIAAAGHAVFPHLNERSFLQRAGALLGPAKSTLAWLSGDPTSIVLSDAADEDFALPRVQYLSQQFVDQLCSSEGLADELVGEIERVVFQAHPLEERLGTLDFRELLDARAARSRMARAQQEIALSEASDALQKERALKESLPALRKQHADANIAIEKDKKDRDSLVGTGQDERLKLFRAVSTAVEEARARVDQCSQRLEALRQLKDAAVDVRDNVSPTQHRALQSTYRNADLTPEQWEHFKLVFAGDVEAILDAEIEKTERELKTLKGPAVGEPPAPPDATKAPSLIPEGAKLAEQTLSLLQKELARVQALVGLDTANSTRYRQLSEKITKAETAQGRLAKEITNSESADGRITSALGRRSAAYKGVFQAIVDEQQTLETLYAPLKANLAEQSGTLNKLSFDVRRIVDVEAWAREGEQILDLRKGGPFRGAGTLLAEANRILRPAWETGTAEDVSAAMATFRETHEANLRQHCPVASSEREAVRKWGSEISAWLYSTRHISVSYGVQYEQVEIERLSPGTRGIVLLLLYLSIDRYDDRPLIIDQPEENLDPKSIFDELVGRFREAKLRRQIIIVTHNANLVVNADADQVIVAKAGTHRRGELPEISYISGGLENPTIREQVCDILEGGAAAFQERAKRLRVTL